MTALSYVTHSPWFVRRTARGTPRQRWIIFPYAGSGPSAFYGWAQLIPPEVDVLILHLPGRERRFADALTGQIDLMVQSIVRDIAELPPAATLFFGYSLGSLIAYEVAKALAERRIAAPDLLAVAAGSSPNNIGRRAAVYDLPQDAFWNKVLSYGGTSAEMVANPELRAYAEPMLRADFQLIDEYRFAAHDGFSFPIIAIAGTRDQVCPPPYVRTWSSFTRGPFEYHEFDDGHFFIQRHGGALYKLIVDFSAAQLGLDEPCE